MSDLELISIVKSFPILYDSNCSRGHKNASLKDEAWRKVSHILDKSERACITRWKSLRDRFCKELRRVEKNPDEPTNWSMFEHLIFLTGHYKHGRVQENLTIKYEPKTKKKKPNNAYYKNIDYANNDDDLDIEETILQQQLISLVKNHKVLYDKIQIRDSKNLTEKNEAWKTISEALNMTEELCYNRWKKLRDRFSREYRSYQLNENRPISWPLFHNLMFLECHYRKGIPLPTNEDASRSELYTSEDDFWGNDYSHTYISDNQTDVDRLIEPVDQLSDQIDNESCESLVNYVEEVPFNHEDDDKDDSCLSQESTDILPDNINIINTEEDYEEVSFSESTCTEVITEDRDNHKTNLNVSLTHVICCMEAAIQETKNCLELLKEEIRQLNVENKSSLNAQPEVIQKIIVLLNGLSDSNRKKAEQRILQFLFEAQIKSLNNENIDHVDHLYIVDNVVDNIEIL